MRLTGLAVLALTLFSTFTVVADDKAKARKLPEPKAADGDAPLPEGWPGGTKPGVIEIKSYPVYRSAIVRGKGAAMGADNVLFWPLFRHISTNNIAMTAPVVSTYSPNMVENDRALGEVSMEFLYQSTQQGKTGPGGGAVKVEDHPAGQFLCLGVQGAMTNEEMIEGVKKLRGWLEEHKSQWAESGSPRRLGYHGPMTPVSKRLWEVQIPIKSVTGPSEKPADVSSAARQTP